MSFFVTATEHIAGLATEHIATSFFVTATEHIAALSFVTVTEHIEARLRRVSPNSFS